LFTIGSVEIRGPVLLAPIAGYTDSPFRRVAVEHGAALTVTELISAEGIVRGGEKTAALARFSPSERPIALQIFGNDPSVMGEAAAAAEAVFSPDIIDINMGCPSARICSGGEGGGAALLRYPELIEKIASSVVKKVKIPVTAKIRTGWDHSSINCFDVQRILENCGISALFVHGRTRAQGFSGKADWNIIKELREKGTIPVIGNGDILSYNEAMERIAFSGCPAVMAGRGAIGNPWIFSAVTPSFEGIKARIVSHLDLMTDSFGQRGIILMRKHIVKYIHGFRNASKYRAGLLMSTTRDEIIEVLNSVEV
jgi:tRNA-dihydrouridine synthase B